MKTKTLKLKDINPAAYNPRVELKEGMDEWEALNNSLGKFGLVVPIIVNERNNTIIGGHQRVAVLKHKGAEEAEAVLLDLDDQREKQLNLALNRTEGRWDFEKLERLLSEMTPEERRFTGFLNEEIEELEINTTSAFAPEPAEEPKEKPFEIYVSFEKDADIEGWLEEHGIEAPPQINPVTVIEMEEK